MRGSAAAVALGILALVVPGAAGTSATWLSPRTLSPPLSIYGSAADVAVDPAGDAIAVWIGPGRSGIGGGVTQTVEASSRPAGGDWGLPVAISSNETPEYQCETCLDPHVAIDATGKAYAVWSFYDESNPAKPYRKIVLRPRSADGTWASHGTIVSTAAVDNRYPRVAVSPGGDVGVVWSAYGTHDLVDGYFQSATGTAHPAQTLSSASQYAYHPEIALSAGGNAVVGFSQTPTGGIRDGVMEVVTRTPAGPWSAPKPISEIGVYESDLAVGRNGDAAAVWSRVDGANVTRVEAAARPAGSPWSSPQALSPPRSGGAYTQSPTVAVGTTGLAVAAWMGVDGTKTIVDAAARGAGAASVWGPAVPLSAPGANALDPRVAVSTAKTGLAIWRRGMSTTFVESASRSPAGTWSAAVPISGTDNTQGPAVAVDAVGNAVATWVGYNGVGGYARAAGLDASGPAFNRLSIPANGVVGHRLSFTVSPFDVWSALGPGPVWSFGDRDTGAGTAVSHAYASPGTYQVTLTQADAVGNTSTTSRRLTITKTPVYCVVPRLVGTVLKKAKAALTRSHCRAGKVSRAYSKRIKKGRILREKPKAGRKLPVGAKVSLVVSRGKRPRR